VTLASARGYRGGGRLCIRKLHISLV
jgi:hypothetical protein